MALVVRTLFNNQRWSAPCRYPGKDERCYLCFEDGRVLRQPQMDDEICTGMCWERSICSHHEWPCTPKGNTWGERVQPGDLVFFVHRDPGGRYSIWGMSRVFVVEHAPRRTGGEHEQGYAFLRVDDFEPLPVESRPHGLTAEQLVGSPWGQGAYRYISFVEAEKLEESLQDLHGLA